MYLHPRDPSTRPICLAIWLSPEQSLNGSWASGDIFLNIEHITELLLKGLSPGTWVPQWSVGMTHVGLHDGESHGLWFGFVCQTKQEIMRNRKNSHQRLPRTETKAAVSLSVERRRGCATSAPQAAGKGSGDLPVGVLHPLAGPRRPPSFLSAVGSAFRFCPWVATPLRRWVALCQRHCLMSKNK